MVEKDFTAGFRISQEEWEAFKKICNNIGIPPSNVLRLFIKKFIKKPDINSLIK